MAGASPRRYAQAAFALAGENEGVDLWQTDLEQAANVLSDPDVVALLSAPQVPDRVKLDGVNTLLQDVVPLVRNLVSLMVVRGDILRFDRVVAVFREFADRQRGTARAEVITAIPLDAARKRRLAQDLARLVETNDVVLTEKVDPDILGGVIARVGDRLIDGSTRARLLKLRDELAAGRAS
jgi:F-type H+-transporting ATPase subunit delta